MESFKMNIKVDFDAIIDACAMKNVLYTEAEIEKMLLGQKPIASPVKHILTALAKGEVITEFETNKTPYISTEEAINQEKEMNLILDIIKASDCTKREISAQAGIDLDRTAYLLQLLSRRHLISAIRASPENIKWTVYNAELHKPIKVRSMNINYRKAQENRDKYYEGSVHLKCGTTLKLTSSRGCVHCKKLIDQKRSYEKKRKKVV